MSYMRGDHYLWTDEEGYLHIWAADGYDGWDDTIWHCEDDGSARASHAKDGRNIASGVCIRQEVIDEYVMMRLAQLIAEGRVDAAIDRANSRHGNYGGMVLAKNADRLKRALANVELDVPEALD